MSAVIFRRELKNYRKNFMFWSFGMFVLILASLAKYAGLSGDSQAANELMSQLPQSIQAVFGMNGFDIASLDGYFGVLFIYLALMVAIHALLLGADIISKEERDRTSEFLYVKPLSRVSILTQKISAGFIYIVTFNVVTCLSSLYLASLYDDGNSISSYIVLLMYALFALQALFYSIGITVASLSSHPKQSSTYGASILLATYVMFFLVNISDKFDVLRYFTPFKYFDSLTILETGTLPMGYMLATNAVVATLIYISYTAYRRRDLEV